MTGSRKFSKENIILRMFKIMRSKAQKYLEGKRSQQEQESRNRASTSGETNMGDNFNDEGAPAKASSA